jgi:hypothetical protein
MPYGSLYCPHSEIDIRKARNESDMANSSAYGRHDSHARILVHEHLAHKAN